MAMGSLGLWKYLRMNFGLCLFQTWRFSLDLVVLCTNNRFITSKANFKLSKTMGGIGQSGGWLVYICCFKQ